MGLFNKGSKFQLKEINDKLLKAESKLSVLESFMDTLLFQQITNNSNSQMIYSEMQQNVLIANPKLLPTNEWTITKEIQFLETYLKIWKILKGEDLHFRVESKIENYDTTIPTLLLIPIVKNAIALGYNSMAAFPLKIKITLISNNLMLEVSNRVNHHIQNQAESTEMDYFKSRLKILYEERFDLFFNSNSNTFKVVFNLKIPS